MPDVTLHASGKLSGLRGHVTAHVGAVLHSTSKLSGLRGHVAARYDNQLVRYLQNAVAAAHQVAVPAQAAVGAHWFVSAVQRGGTASAWQTAAQRGKAVAAQLSIAAVRATTRTLVWQLARPLGAQAAAAHQRAHELAVSAASAYQVAQALRYITTSGMQTAKPLRIARTTGWQLARPLHHAHVGRSGASLHIVGRHAELARWQTAMHPPSGRSVRPQPPQPGEPCYLPSPHLLFDAPWLASGHLVFVCERHVPPPEPGATVVVPIRRYYMTINSLSLRRVDGNVPIPSDVFAMSLDADSWTWSWSASLPADALPLVQPGSDGNPIEVEALVNGVPYRLCVEGISRQREFAKGRINVQGRGTAAVLDSPYAPVLNHGNTAARTAQQLMGDALQLNGVPIGWGVDWGLTDWLVPANVWAYQGAYIGAILDIAQAAGGYVQPHNTAQTLRILPRYPAAPWNWAALTPDFELPVDVTELEGIDWVRKPNYSRVFVSGAGQGRLGQVTRAGTAGDVLAPMVVDPLITHADAARQRGLSILSDSGGQARITLKLPVLAETGLIKPGQFVRYVDGPTTRLGLVRSTALEWQFPKMRQSISLETHIS